MSIKFGHVNIIAQDWKSLASFYKKINEKMMIKKTNIAVLLIAFSIIFLYRVNQKSGSIKSALQNIQHAYYKLAVSLTGNADDLANLGMFYFDHDQQDLAEQYLLKASENGNAIAIGALGFLYGKQGKWDLAEKYLKITADQQNNPKIFLLLVSVYMQQKKFDLALPYCIKAAEQGNPQAIAGLGFIYEAQLQFDLAEQCFLKALEVKDAIPTELIPSIYNGLGTIYFAQAKLEPAKKWLRLSGSEQSKELLGCIDKLESPELRGALDEIKADPKLIEDSWAKYKQTIKGNSASLDHDKQQAYE